MSTTTLHLNALPGVPWVFIAKDPAPTGTVPFDGVACFTNETLSKPGFTTEALTRPGFTSETLAKPGFVNETLTKC